MHPAIVSINGIGLILGIRMGNEPFDRHFADSLIRLRSRLPMDTTNIMDNDDDYSWCSTTHVADVPPTKIPRFTDLGSDGPAATVVIKYLVQAVGPWDVM